MTTPTSTPISTPVGVGVIGMGFMGRTHAAAYADNAARSPGACRLVAVSDPNPERMRAAAATGGNIGPGDAIPELDRADLRRRTEPSELLADPDVHLVSICTPTDTHIDLALAAINSGKHVLVEKPVALDAEQIRRLAEAAAARDRLVMPAMCMRFWPGWTHLKAALTDGRYGSLHAISFTRLGTRPAWSPDFYANAGRTGGAMTDLHIHDADFIVHLLGRPRGVVSAGSVDHVTTHYLFARGIGHVVAEGGWLPAAGMPFRMRFTASFENATLDFELGREHPLMIARDGEWTPVDGPSGNGYQPQIDHMIAAVHAHRAGERFRLAATLSDAITVAEVLAAERESLSRSGEPVILPA